MLARDGRALSVTTPPYVRPFTPWLRDRLPPLAGFVTDVKVLVWDAAEVSVTLTALSHGLAAARTILVGTNTEVDDIDELLGRLAE